MFLHGGSENVMVRMLNRNTEKKKSRGRPIGILNFIGARADTCKETGASCNFIL